MEVEGIVINDQLQSGGIEDVEAHASVGFHIRSTHHACSIQERFLAMG